ncbi:MAG: sulfatase-like hydrolase/transferase [Williamsia sp.]|nr:sulfatase-like hydrolase/transferase [Williamsia sp.]
MKIKRNWLYYLLLLMFPFSFLLHNVNENFGLIGIPLILHLFLIYAIITLSIAVVSRFVFKSDPKALSYAFVLLVVYFLFGVYKDFAKQGQLPPLFNSYKFVLPLLLAILLLIGIIIKRSKHNFIRLSQAIQLFLVVNVLWETGWCLYNMATGAQSKKDFGDYYHSVIRDVQPAAGSAKPVVFWIVFDEYANSSTLQKVWGFSNPLDSALIRKGFFVADSSRSNYNFTHYSIASTLDMTYLPDLKNHSVVRLKDLQRGAFSIYSNNVVELFRKNGYAIKNYSIFPLENYPTQGMKQFEYVPELLINFQTFGGRVRKDIGWNFPNMLKADKHLADSLTVVKSMVDLDSANKALLSGCLNAVKKEATSDTPSFYLFHFMLPHEPYMYRPDGSVAFERGYTALADYYTSHLQYTNRIIVQLTDSILSACRAKNKVIILQGDHGFRFKETDPLYDMESCKNFYAVYCSDGNYTPWYGSLSMVNSFRIFFNKYFQTRLPLLPDTSYNLYYR